MFLQRHQNTLARIATLGLSLLAAVLLASLVWQLVLLAKPAPLLLSPEQLSQSPAANGPQYDLQSLLAVPLFGEQQKAAKPEAKPIVAPVSQAPARKTRLNIRLLGVLANDDHGDGVAILKHDGKTYTYAVGEELKTRESIVLAAVFPDYVEIERGGARERIDLAKKAEARGISSAAASSQTVLGSNSSASRSEASSRNVDLTDGAVRQVLGDVRETLRSNPLKLARYIRLNPRLAGTGPKGYTLSAGPDRALFEQLGLRDGDLVTHINEQALANANLAELRALLDSGAGLQISLLRNGEQQTINVTL